MDTLEQERIFTTIYTECDENNDDVVQVSALMSYMAPYIESSSFHLSELSKVLDPKCKNPCINKQTFINAMKNWAEKFKNEVDFNFSSNENIDHQNRQLTPSRELDALNLSNISGYSLTGSTLSANDKNVLQEQNNELQHQNKKLTEYLNDVRYQLTGLEEQNVSLQNEVDKLTKHYKSDQKLIQSLQSKCMEYEKEKEEYINVIGDNRTKLSNIISLKKIKANLEIRIKELELENKTHMESITRLSDLIIEKEKDNVLLEKEIENRDTEILKIQEKEAEWMQKCSENDRNINLFMEQNEHLKNQLQSMEARMQNLLLHHTSTENFEPDPQSDSVKLPTSSEEEDYCSKLLEVNQLPLHGSLQEELFKASHSSHSDCFASCEEKLKHYEEEIEKLLEELDNRSRQIRDVTDSKDIIEIELQTTQTQKHKLKAENKKMIGKLKYYKIMYRHLDYQIKEKKNEVANLKKVVDENETKLKCYECDQNKLLEATELITRMKDEIMCKVSEIEDMKLTLDNFTNINNKYEKLLNEFNYLNTDNDMLKSEVLTLETALNLERENASKLDVLCIEMNQLQKQLDEEKNKNSRLTTNINNLTTEKEKLLVSLKSAEITEGTKKKIESLECKLQNLRKKCMDLENQYICKIEELNTVNFKNNELENKLQKISQDYNSLNSHIIDVKLIVKGYKEFLKTNTLFTLDIWTTIIKQIFPDLDLTNLVNMSILSDSAKDIHGPLEEEVNLLKHQIHQTTSLLKALAKIKSKMCIAPEKKYPFQNSAQNLCKPGESADNNESFFTKLASKKFRLKPPTLILKPEPQFVFPPMSPECSQPEMNDVQLHNEVNNKHFELKIIETNKTTLEMNNNLPVTGMSDSKDLKTYEDTASKEENNEQTDEKLATTNGATLDATKDSQSCTDTYINQILMEFKIQDPVAKIDETHGLTSEGSENSGSESSLKCEDETGDKAEKDASKNNEKNEQKLIDEEEEVKECLARQVRSMSEGAAVVHQLSKDGDVMVFPNLPDNALDALGLLPNAQANNGCITLRARTFQRTTQRRRSRTKIPDTGACIQYRRCYSSGSFGTSKTSKRSSRGQSNCRGEQIYQCGTQTKSTLRGCGDNGTSDLFNRSSGSYSSSFSQDIDKCGNIRQCAAGMADFRLSEFNAKSSSKPDKTEGYCSPSIAMHQTDASRGVEFEFNYGQSAGNFNTTTLDVKQLAIPGGEWSCSNSSTCLDSHNTTTTGLTKYKRSGRNRERSTNGCAPNFRHSVLRAAGAFAQALGLQKSPRMESGEGTQAIVVVTTQPTGIESGSDKNSGRFSRNYNKQYG